MTKKILPCNTGGASGAWDSRLWPRYFYIACLQVVLACLDFPWESRGGGSIIGKTYLVPCPSY